jgi:hypothetical protein
VLLGHVEGDARQPRAQRAIAPVLRPPPPHDDEHVLDQILDVALADAGAAERPIEVVDLRRERVGAARELGRGGARLTELHRSPWIEVVPSSSRR